jgi:hypothetical protein
MKLKSGTIYKLAEMICGQGGTEPPAFPYRSLSSIERFFVNSDLEGYYSGSRHTVTKDVLSGANRQAEPLGKLPSDGIIRAVQELLDPTEFERCRLDIGVALQELNDLLSREGLEAYLDGSNTCQLRAGDVTSASIKPETPGFSPRELQVRAEWELYLDNASEDSFTEKVLVPLLFHVGFQRISAAGHKDKALEYGKDIWMKFRLPTSHWIYFGVQVKKGRLDSAARTRAENENISEVLNQVKMALDTEVWDPDINKTVLVDHVYIVASGEITKAARKLLGEKLNRESRRHIIFMDREDVLTLAAKANLKMPEVVDVAF